MESPHRRYDLDTARVIGYRVLERADAEQALQATTDHGAARRSAQGSGRDRLTADRARIEWSRKR